ncbi:MAG TPA: 16S rRNA (guanine(527)-N(7))-methyltransferase RsmG [Clostridiaceae bacterium]|nr:16S rRNA (guanine(527)-N(7))-methyltransferase RsmG [Clostridiaceae bacterium]
MQEELRSILVEGAGKYGITLDEEEVNTFFMYARLLKEWNKKINLTAIEEGRDIIIKHFIDSLSIVPFLKPYESLIDVGTGAGFPGIPVKIALENINVVLLDSLEKRINFLNTVISETGITGIKAIHGRAEDFGKDVSYREKFDVSVARAVANLPVLLEYCLPFVKVGGIFIAMKGSNLEELDSSRKALDVLGGEIEKVEQFSLPFDDIRRSVIIIKKLRHTPTKYPRKAGKPSKEPLI